MVLVTIGMKMFESARVPVLEDAVCRSFCSRSPSFDHAGDCRADKNIQVRLADLSWIEYAYAIQGAQDGPVLVPEKLVVG